MARKIPKTPVIPTTSPATPRGPRLDTLAKVRREAVKLYNSSRYGELSTADASRLAGVLDLVGRLIEKSDLEARIAALEEAER